MDRVSLRMQQITPGKTVEYYGRRSRDKRAAVVDRYWDVYEQQCDHPDDCSEVIGQIRYVMVVHERRSPGRTWVHDRWQTPGWQYRMRDGERWGPWSEAIGASRAACLRTIEARRRWG